MNKRKLIYKKTDGICAHCGKKITLKNYTVDHFVPKSYCGGMDEKNLFPLCKQCNLERGNEIVDPYEYYIYAKKHAIEKAIRYYNKWKEDRTSFCCKYYIT